jgi:hypothetical protein
MRAADLGVLKPVESSNIQAMGHDPETHDFLVRWKDGKVSVYSDVPDPIARQVLESASAGRAVRSTLVPNFRHNYLEGEGR